MVLKAILGMLAVALLLMAFQLGIWRGEDQQDEHQQEEQQRPAQAAPRERESANPPEASAPPDNAETRSAITARLAVERQRLEELRSTLNAVRQTPAQPPTGSSEAHIENLSRRIAALEEQLVANRAASAGVAENAQFYKQAQVQPSNQAQLNLQAQVTSLSAQIVDLQTRLRQLQALATPVPLENLQALQLQIQSLQSRRELLRSQLESLKLSEKNQMSQIDQQRLLDHAQLRNEQLDLERRLADLRADLEYWKTQNSATTVPPTLRTQRIADLEREIERQQARVDELQEQLARVVR